MDPNIFQLGCPGEGEHVERGREEEGEDKRPPIVLFWYVFLAFGERGQEAGGLYLRFCFCCCFLSWTGQHGNTWFHDIDLYVCVSIANLVVVQDREMCGGRCLFLCARTHRRPSDRTLSVVMEAFNTRGKDEMFATYVDSITRAIKKDPCGQNG